VDRVPLRPPFGDFHDGRSVLAGHRRAGRIVEIRDQVHGFDARQFTRRVETDQRLVQGFGNQSVGIASYPMARTPSPLSSPK